MKAHHSKLSKILLWWLLAAVCKSSYAEVRQDSFIAYQGGKIILFALPGCSMDGGRSYNLYGHLEYPNGKHEVVCWNFSNDIISIYFLDDSVKQFPPNFVEIEGAERHEIDDEDKLVG